MTFYGKVSSADPASGQPVQRLLLQVSAERKAFDTYPLAELDPVACLGRLNVVSSPHPYDLVPVQPAVDFDSLPYSQRAAEGAESPAIPAIAKPWPKSGIRQAAARTEQVAGPKGTSQTYR